MNPISLLALCCFDLDISTDLPAQSGCRSGGAGRKREGVGLAAALPNTDLEDSYLSETSETVRSKAAAIAGQQIDKAATVASDVVDKAKNRSSQGLTFDAKAAMDGLSGKLGRVVDAAGKNFWPIVSSRPRQKPLG